MKSRILLIVSVILLFGCSTGVVPTGGNTYMVAVNGSNITHEVSLKAECFKQANDFCASKGLIMVPVSTTGHDGSPVPFGRGASCELIFKAVPAGSPEAVQPASIPDNRD